MNRPFVMPAPSTPQQQNHLLAALPQAVYERLLPKLELVPMPLGEVVYTSGSELPYLYFPTTCIVSLVYVMGQWSVGGDRGDRIRRLARRFLIPWWGHHAKPGGRSKWRTCISDRGEVSQT